MAELNWFPIGTGGGGVGRGGGAKMSLNFALLSIYSNWKIYKNNKLPPIGSFANPGGRYNNRKSKQIGLGENERLENYYGQL